MLFLVHAVRCYSLMTWVSGRALPTPVRNETDGSTCHGDVLWETDKHSLHLLLGVTTSFLPFMCHANCVFFVRAIFMDWKGQFTSVVWKIRHTLSVHNPPPSAIALTFIHPLSYAVKTYFYQNANLTDHLPFKTIKCVIRVTTREPLGGLWWNFVWVVCHRGRP